MNWRQASAVCAVFAGIGCSAASTSPGGEDTGSVSMEIATVPPDGTCLQITVTGNRTVTQSFNLMAGQPAQLTMNNLPVGNVNLTEQAFSGLCSAVTPTTVPNWVSDPTPATLKAGAIVNVTVVLHPNAGANVTSDFDAGAACGIAGAPCASATDCCGGNACVSGVCSTQPPVCGGEGAACTSSSACCSSICLNNACAAPVTCAAPTVVCHALIQYCANTTNDPYNCGTCGTTCATGQACVAGACTASMCTANGTSCATGASCCSGICAQGLCTAMGTTCNPTGYGCNTNASCCSGVCGALGVCIVPQPTCTDGMKDANETDTDCGGSVCATCATGKACLLNMDCQSKNCTMGVCH